MRQSDMEAQLDLFLQCAVLAVSLFVVCFVFYHQVRDIWIADGFAFHRLLYVLNQLS